MAELAIGISKTAVQLLADKVQSAIKEEAKQWQILQQNLVFITGEFEMMQSFLNSADGERVKNHVLRTWVRQVRDLSNDVEDCIEFVLHLDTKQSWWLRLLPSCSCSCTEGSELPLDLAVTQIEQLKTRVEDVSQRNLRYRFGDSRSDPLTQQQFVSASAIGAPGFDDIHIEAKDTASSCRGAVDLTKLVTETSNDLRVISLWGTGDDLGTMSIIRNMYDDPTIYRHFRCRAWVKVTHPVNPPELIRSLVVQFYANSCQEQGSTVSIDSQPWLCRLKLKKKRDALSWTETSAGDLVEEFVRQVNTNRYLIILEDLSTVVQWDAIRPYLRDRKNGSCIVVSTRHHEIASLCTGKPYLVSELQRFSANQDIRVFFNAGFKDAEGGARVKIVQEPESVELWLSDNRLFGRDSEVDKLFSLINDRPYTDKPHVVSVWGIPGSGRTAVVTNVCYRCYAKPGNWWRIIIMSQPYKYNLMGFCRCILSAFPESSFEVKNPIEGCREHLHNYQCLVVIDEMQSKEFWDLIKAENLISPKSRSCIVVITTEESIAIHCTGADDLVCSIRCLQPMAAFDLLQQIGEQEFRTQTSQNDRNSSEQSFPSKRNSFAESAVNYIFEPDREDEHTFQNNEDHTFQNNGNALEEQAYQNQENTIEEQAFQNNGNSSGNQAFQNGNTFEEQELQSNNGSSSCTTGSTVKEQPFQNNGNSVKDQAFHNDRNLFEEQILWNNGKLSIEHAFWSLFDTQKQEEHVFENKGTTSEEQAFQNSENLFEGQAFKNSENLVEEQTFQNSEDIPYEDELPFEKNSNLLQEVYQSGNNKNRCFSLSRDDPNVKAILSRSGGFPQVIVALGRYLAKQHLSNARTREWQCQHLIGNFMQELQTNPDFYCLRSLLAWIHFYFRSSPSLMRCMLYLLVFPREQTFHRGRLVRRWIAEGYAKGSTESASLDEFAGELFDKLTSQSVMQQVVTPTNMGTRYEVNGFFHEYMISRPVEEKILFPLEVSVLQEGYRRLTTQGVGQHLSIWSSWVRNRVVFDNLDLSRLRSLTVFGCWEAFMVSDKMKVLRVLDLEDACDVTDDDVEKIGKVLLRLKFLSLRGCKKIKRVPDSFGGLRQLQTLDIRQTSVATLPVSITKLEKLQYLGAGTTSLPLGDHTSNPSPATADPSLSTLQSLFPRYPQLPNGGVVVPGRIGQMTALHTLGVINVSVASGRATLKELKKLTQLRKLGVSGVNRDNCQELCSAISCHAYLESFSVWFDKGVNRAGCLDTISRPPLKLQSLKLYGLVDSNLPTWINNQLTNLGKLNLQMTTIPQQEVDALGNLPKLTTLCLHLKEFQCGKLDFHTGFHALQLLQVACTSRSQAVTFHAGAMHKLEVMNLPCHDVPSFLRFNGLETLRKLKEISLSGSYDDAMKQQLQSQLDAHPREMKPFLKVEPRSS